MLFTVGGAGKCHCLHFSSTLIVQMEVCHLSQPQDPSPHQPRPSPKGTPEGSPSTTCPRTPLHSATTAPAISPMQHRGRASWNTPGLYMLQLQLSHQSPPCAEFPKTFWPPHTSAAAVPPGGYLHRVPLDHLVHADLSSRHSVRHPPR